MWTLDGHEVERVDQLFSRTLPMSRQQKALSTRHILLPEELSYRIDCNECRPEVEERRSVGWDESEDVERRAARAGWGAARLEWSKVDESPSR